MSYTRDLSYHVLWMSMVTGQEGGTKLTNERYADLYKAILHCSEAWHISSFRPTLY